MSLNVRSLRPRLVLRPLLAAMLTAGAMGPVWAAAPTIADNALPTSVQGSVGLTLRAGTAEVTTTTTNAGIATMTATQTSAKAVWEAQDFNIGAKAAFVNSAASANSDTLIRVIGGGASVIAGSVSANNRLWLVNSNGLYVSSTGSVSAPSVLMSARDISDASSANGYQSFMKGDPVSFARGANGNDLGGFIAIDPGATITADANGSVVLLGHNYIYNQGKVSTQGGGEVSMLVANDAEVAIGDSGYITLGALTSTAGTNSSSINGRAVFNTGTVQADNGTVQLIVAGAGSNDVPIVPPVTTQVANGSTPGSINGVYNAGIVQAQTSGVNGSSTVLLKVVGDNGNLINTGRVDVSSAPGDTVAKAGTINLVGRAIGISGANALLAADEVRGLLANGAAGGGNINLVANGSNSDLSNFMLVESTAQISADATIKGNGGTIRLLGASNVDTVYGNRENVVSQGYTSTTLGYAAGPSNVVLQGTLRARGGVQGGDGGTVVASAGSLSTRVGGSDTVTKANFDVSARATGGKAGWIRLFSPFMQIGTEAYFAGSDITSTQIVNTDLSDWLSTGANVQLATYRDANYGGRGSLPTLEVLDGVVVTSKSSTAQTLQLDSAGDLFLGRSASGANITIEAANAPLNVSFNSDTDQLGLGAINLVGTQAQVLTAVPGQARAQANNALPVTVRSHGGNITFNGANRATAQASTTGDAVVLDNVVLDAQGGNIDIYGAGGSYQSEGTLYFNGVVMASASLTGANISVLGHSDAAIGVQLTDVGMSTTTNGNIDIIGLSNTLTGEGTHIGVDAQSLTADLGGAGKLRIAGLATGGAGNDAIGVRVDSLEVLTSGAAQGGAVPRVTVVGQSSQSSEAGLDMSSGIYLHQLSNTSGQAPSTAEVVLGAHADASASNAMTLGGSKFYTTGRINVRPLKVSATGQVQEDVGTGIYVGVPFRVESPGTNFFVDPRLLNGQMGTGLNVVIGSSLQVGRITLADNVLNGQVTTTLQNQGVGSEGIVLGAQSGTSVYVPASVGGLAHAAATDAASAGVLNLVTTGNVSQTGTLVADVVNVVAGPQSQVSLNAFPNQIGSLLVSGGRNVSVPAGATPASTGTVSAFDAGNNQFVTLAVNTGNSEVTTPPVTDSPGVTAVKESTFPVESADALSELRTDVYVRGQFTRPQVCTPANTGGSVSIDVDADPLAQNWLQVRRSAQLSSCSGVRNDSNCAAF